jgi:hypothetical protein
MEPVTNLANFGTGANAQTADTTKPEAMMYKENYI